LKPQAEDPLKKLFLFGSPPSSPLPPPVKKQLPTMSDPYVKKKGLWASRAPASP
jgi:hypothetical protein